MTDYTDLKRLAEALAREKWRQGREGGSGADLITEIESGEAVFSVFGIFSNTRIDDPALKTEKRRMPMARAAYIAAANPSVILSLIAEIERLRDMVRRLQCAADAISMGRTVHNDRFPDKRLEGPLWSNLDDAITAARAHIEEKKP